MRIPASTIVMSLVTAVPFGLAIRDTLKDHDTLLDELEPYERAELEAAEQRELAEASARAAEQEAKTNEARRMLFGASPGTPGAVFASVAVLGSAVQRDDITVPDGKLAVTQESRGGVLTGILVELTGDCSELDTQLVSAWGRSSSTPAVWIDPASHVRAVFDVTRCTLRFDRYADSMQWMKSLPMSQIGRGAEPFEATLRDKRVANVDDDGFTGFRWLDLGVGAGEGPTRYQAAVDDEGRTVGFKASVTTDELTASELESTFQASYGPSAPERGSRHRRPEVHLDTTNRDSGFVHVELWVGTIR